MQIYHRLTALPPAAFGRGSAVALGFFDGVHIGHRAVISAAVDCARAEGLEAAVEIEFEAEGVFRQRVRIKNVGQKTVELTMLSCFLPLFSKCIHSNPGII